jgi:uncharacterized protein (DUF924 family)
MALWFGGAPETDEQIRRRFEPWVGQAAEGRLSAWEASAESCLALILLLDQFTLNIYRDQAKSFELNDLALPIALRALERGDDQRVEPVRRVFFYLPLEHSEDLTIQNRAVALFQRLVDEARPEEAEMMKTFHHFAVLHQEVIARFGRFPDRNPILGRASTPEEQAYLDAGGPPF